MTGLDLTLISSILSINTLSDNGDALVVFLEIKTLPIPTLETIVALGIEAPDIKSPDLIPVVAIPTILVLVEEYVAVVLPIEDLLFFTEDSTSFPTTMEVDLSIVASFMNNSSTSAITGVPNSSVNNSPFAILKSLTSLLGMILIGRLSSPSFISFSKDINHCSSQVKLAETSATAALASYGDWEEPHRYKLSITFVSGNDKYSLL